MIRRFQSSLGPEAERYEVLLPLLLGLYLFQSSLGPEAERYDLPVCAGAVRWPFQSSLGPEAERYVTSVKIVVTVLRVSILARPGGRALLAFARPLGSVSVSFQSSLGPEAERYDADSCFREAA